MPGECLDQVAALLAADPGAEAATLYWPIDAADEVRDPNAVKVVTSQTGDALCFSRSPLPFPRGHDTIEAAMQSGLSWNRHLGLYCYRHSALRKFTSQEPTPLERAEKLEQMRFLETGGRIRIAQASRAIPAGIDTPEDLERIRRDVASGRR